jgi:hypothetical protein
MAVQVELATHVATALGLVVGTSVFHDDLPEDAIDGSVGLFLYDAAAPEHDMGFETLRYERPQIQAMVRHATQASALARIKAVRDTLVAIVNENVGGIYYVNVGCISGPMFLKKDANQRWCYVANFDVEKVPS